MVPTVVVMAGWIGDSGARPASSFNTDVIVVRCLDYLNAGLCVNTVEPNFATGRDARLPKASPRLSNP